MLITRVMFILALVVANRPGQINEISGPGTDSRIEWHEHGDSLSGSARL